MSRTEMKRIIEYLKIENSYLKERIEIIENALEFNVPHGNYNVDSEIVDIVDNVDSEIADNVDSEIVDNADSDSDSDSDTEIDYGDDSEEDSGLVDNSDTDSNNELSQTTPFVVNDLAYNDLTENSTRSLENHPNGKDEKATGINPICVVCMENKACVVNIDCGHLCLCFCCSKKIYSSYGGCPTCRKPYVNLCKVFF